MVTASSVSLHPKMVINERLSQYIAWQHEVLVSPNIKTFLEAIAMFSVGSRINPTTTVGKWMLSYIAGKCKVKKIDNFINMDNIDPEQNPDYLHDDGISMLLITTEGY